MSGGGSLRQSIGALDGNFGRDVRLGGSISLHGCEVGDETVQTKAHRGSRNARVESRACIGSGAALPGGGTVK
jgi:carbonic anhydrase/acetyltransferase-like protein (isoleucine patch superfamily)